MDFSFLLKSLFLPSVEQFKVKKIKVKKIILDPVMVAKGGTKLVDNKSIKIIRFEIQKRAHEAPFNQLYLVTTFNKTLQT